MSFSNHNHNDKQETSSILSHCACGQVQIHVHLPSTAAPTNDNDDIDSSECMAVDCHCPACRKFHVAAFASYLHLPINQVDFGDSTEALQTYTETCQEIGPVERLFCRHCYTKVASKPIAVTVQENTEQEVNTKEPKILVNMGGIVDKTIPKTYLESWQKQRTIWQQNSQAIWPQAKPPPMRRRGRMPPLLTTTTKGSCACGKCQYQIRHAPYEMQHCYCRLCRQCCGSAFQTWVPVANEDFVWTTTPPPVLKRTTNHGRRHFCTTCGSSMTIVYDEDPETTWPAAGGLDDSSLPKTCDDMNEYLGRVCHICCIWKQSWYSIPNDGLERIKYAC